MHFTAEPSTLTGEAESVVSAPGLLARKRACLTGTPGSFHISEPCQVPWSLASRPFASGFSFGFAGASVIRFFTDRMAESVLGSCVQIPCSHT